MLERVKSFVLNLLLLAPLYVMLGVMVYWKTRPTPVQYATTRASEVQAFALANFATLDIDENGTIGEWELELFINKSSRFSGAERDTLEHMYRYRSYVGHVVRTETHEVTDMVPMFDTNGGAYLIPSKRTETTYVYGISKSDLENYPERLKQMK